MDLDYATPGWICDARTRLEQTHPARRLISLISYTPRATHQARRRKHGVLGPDPGLNG